MKIAYVLYGRFPTEKAHGIQVAKVCEALGKKATVTLVVPDFVASRESDPFMTYGIERTFSVKRIMASGPHSNSSVFLWSKLLFLVRAARYLREQGNDLVITREALFISFARMPVLLELHDLPRWRVSYTRLWKRAHLIVAKTEFLRDELVAACVSSSKILVLPNAVDLEAFAKSTDSVETRRRYGLPDKEPIALYVGSFQPWKGVSTVVAAARYVPEVLFVIAGGAVTDRANLAGPSPASNLRFVGQVPHASVPALLKSADFLILPNSKGTQVSERYTSPLKLFEYMASHRPIVASRLPSIQEALSPDEGFYFEPDNAEDLARSVREALAHPSVASARADAAFARVSRNTWDTYIEHLLASVSS